LDLIDIIVLLLTGLRRTGRIVARDHDKGAPDPSLAVYIDMIDHLNNLAWNIWPRKGRTDSREIVLRGRGLSVSAGLLSGGGS
jgi:hypothetical protein